MGCGSSKPRPRNDGIPLHTNISGPVTPPGAVPAPVRDERGLWVVYDQADLSSQNISRALGFVAQYLRERNEDLVIIAVGGAVNTVLLKTRNVTHDVDFFGATLDGRRLRMLREAGQFAIERSSVQLSQDWLNNATARMPGVVENIDHLIQAAVEQNDVLFSERGLKVLAAPWRYAFVKKVSRLTQGTGRTYDAADAVAYIHQHILRHGNMPVPIGEVRAWGNQYRALVPDIVLHQINTLYGETYRGNAIAF